MIKKPNHSSHQECVREESNSTSITITQQIDQQKNIFPEIDMSRT